MTGQTPSAERRGRIEASRTECRRLVNACKNESIKKVVRIAEADLNEAETWLRETDVDQRPVLFGIVDLCIELADTRLNEMAKLLEKFGADAIAIVGD